MKPKYDDIKRLFGDLDDHTIAEIEASGATMNELEEVVAYLAQETDVMADLRRSLSGRALAIYDLLRSQDARWDEPG
ncbi:hypothetical protein [Marimonas arenosa]|uniref:Uncharacterized protein n=1 Tax=Marimonas arenosa TaxID=1795305 RepID=A0AAE4B3B9_9RHOB|nr:hypothetical protein [Marimonas arenosa]MDQ2089898.1 hypothetical protein [Marimonas arenosa]